MQETNQPPARHSKGQAQPAIDIATEKLYDTADLLQLLHISARTLQYWRSHGIIQFIKVRRKIFYRQRDVEAMLQKGRLMFLFCGLWFV